MEKLNLYINSYLRSYDIDYGAGYYIDSSFDEQTLKLYLTISLTFFEGTVVFNDAMKNLIIDERDTMSFINAIKGDNSVHYN